MFNLGCEQRINQSKSVNLLLEDPSLIQSRRQTSCRRHMLDGNVHGCTVIQAHPGNVIPDEGSNYDTVVYLLFPSLLIQTASVVDW